MAAMIGSRRDRCVRAEGPPRPGTYGYRHGRGAGTVTLGGRRVPVERPRMRAVDGSGEPPGNSSPRRACLEPSLMRVSGNPL